MLDANGVFAVSILGQGQKKLASTFFKPVKSIGDKFEDVEFYTAETGTPIIKEALSFFECKVINKVEEGDHWIYLGEVINAGVHRQGESLALRETGWQYGG